MTIATPGSTARPTARQRRLGRDCALATLITASALTITTVAACSGNRDNAADDGRCRDGMCCEPGERMAAGYPKGCPHGGHISRCERTGGNCISRTDDGQYAINCWTPDCAKCADYAPDYGYLVQWCSEN
jgi:hypothetical protein